MDNHILRRSKELEEQAITIRRDIHKHPEIGFELERTISLVMKELTAYGYAPERIGKAGITALVGKGEKTFLLRADMDALPMQEETSLEFSSCNKFMHACGHDIHTTSLLMAAKILKENDEQLCGQVKLMFQPCEEAMGGAIDMVSAGILKNPKPDAAMALHVLHAVSGKVGYSRNYACASSDIFTIHVKGKGCHGAAPYLGVDPINAAVHIHLALQALNSREVNPDVQALNSREVNPDEMVVLNVCQIHGGTASNIVPESSFLQGSIRTMNPEVRAFVKKRLVEIAEGTAKALRAEAVVEFFNEGAPPMLNNNQLLDDVTESIDHMLGAGTCYEIPRMTGSEDFSVISQEVPSVLLWVGTGSAEEGYPYGVHDARVTFNESVIYKIAAIYADTAMNWLKRYDTK